jgi:hypothetical protein
MALPDQARDPRNRSLNAWWAICVGSSTTTAGSSARTCRAARLQSVSLAYDDILCACCKALQIPWSGRPPLAGVDRLEMEASLAQRGVTW